MKPFFTARNLWLGPLSSQDLSKRLKLIQLLITLKNLAEIN